MRDIIETLHQPPTPVITGSELKRYSLARVISALVAGHPDTAGLEWEVSETLAKRHQGPQTRNGILLPCEVLQRDLTVASAAGGGYLVSTSNVGFIELARPRSVLVSLGVTPLEGLRGNVTIPRIASGATVTSLATETGQAAESTPQTGQIALTPKTASAYVEVSRNLIQQSSPSVERVLSAELVGAIGQAIDTLGIAGTGASGEPLGIVNSPGIGSQSGTSLDRDGLLSMQANAGDTLSLAGGYAAPVATAQLLGGRETVTGSGRYLWDGNLHQGALAGYPAMSSNNVPTGQLLFGGDWSSVIVAMWGDAIELAVNPYANFPAGIVGVRVVQSFDIGIRQPTTFTATTTVT